MFVDLTDVSHAFLEGQFLFQGVTARLVPGRLYSISGPSGSGKSTLLGLIAGWIDPTAGSVKREGVSGIQWVFQNPHGVARRSALDHVSLPLMVRGYRRDEAEEGALALIESVSLQDATSRPFRTLSGGEAQRLMLARALAAAPDLLLVDEPTAQLDFSTAQEVIAALSALAHRDVIVAIATHDHRVKAACDDEIVLGRGE